MTHGTVILACRSVGVVDWGSVWGGSPSWQSQTGRVWDWKNACIMPGRSCVKSSPWPAASTTVARPVCEAAPEAVATADSVSLICQVLMNAVRPSPDNKVPALIVQSNISPLVILRGTWSFVQLIGLSEDQLGFSCLTQLQIGSILQSHD